MNVLPLAFDLERTMLKEILEKVINQSGIGPFEQLHNPAYLKRLNGRPDVMEVSHD